MSQLGRGGVVELLKRYGDLRGELRLDLAELLQPTIQLADLSEELPFSLSVPAHADVQKAAGGAGTYAGVSLYTTNAGDWLELEWIQNRAASADFMIVCQSAVGYSSGAAGVGLAPRRLRGTADLGGLGSVTATSGYAGVAPSSPLFRLTQGELYRLRFCVGGGFPAGSDQGVLNIFTSAVNTAITLALGLRLHFVSAR